MSRLVYLEDYTQFGYSLPIDLADETIKYEIGSKLVYSPLTEDDGIRILLLQPAISPDGKPQGFSLQHISLAQHLDDLIDRSIRIWPYHTYRVIRRRVDKVLVDDHELGITANPSAALRNLRGAGRTHKLWAADAVCID
ncbi:hypothetical protein F5B21DRAFT_506237 [Xylaria acuta]|nr:hypothetical protein F5B21DRAFT_506237 [Xylaria acuta]